MNFRVVGTIQITHKWAYYPTPPLLYVFGAMPQVQPGTTSKLSVSPLIIYLLSSKRSCVYMEFAVLARPGNSSSCPPNTGILLTCRPKGKGKHKMLPNFFLPKITINSSCPLPLLFGNERQISVNVFTLVWENQI